MDNTDIDLIGKIKPGDTINIKSKEIVIYRSWYASYTRWYYEENRNQLPDWIQNVLSNELTVLSRMTRADLITDQRDKILLAISGVRNLCITYLGDPITVRLSLILSTIERKLYYHDSRTSKYLDITQRGHRNDYYLDKFQPGTY